MQIKRKLEKVDTPQGQPGFMGAGHTARPVLKGGFTQTDPFIMLMDDVLDKKDTTPAGGPHPHAGFETVSFLLEGEMGDEAHTMKAGDFQIMTAGQRHCTYGNHRQGSPDAAVAIVAEPS